MEVSFFFLSETLVNVYGITRRYIAELSLLHNRSNVKELTK
jgi:hypothetical protein